MGDKPQFMLSLVVDDCLEGKLRTPGATVQTAGVGRFGSVAVVAHVLRQHRLPL